MRREKCGIARSLAPAVAIFLTSVALFIVTSCVCSNYKAENNSENKNGVSTRAQPHDPGTAPDNPQTAPNSEDDNPFEK